jgi:hypothetical protein
MITQDTFTNTLQSVVDQSLRNIMPSGSFSYRDYMITPTINDNPYLFHTWDACSTNSPRRRIGKTVYLVTLKGYAEETYFKSLNAAKRFIRACVAPR